MNWYYESGGQQHGPIPDSELDRLLAEGKITQDTLVWREGLPAWAPLRSTRPAPSAAAAPGPAPTGAADAPPPGYIRCSLTGKYCPPSEIIYIEGKPYSAEAKPQVMQSLQSGTALPGGDFDRTGPPWEQRATIGMVKAIWETIKAVLTQPSHTFATMRREGGLGGPLLFLVLTAGIGAALNQLYGLLFQGAAFGMMGLGQLGGQGGGPPAAALGMNMAMQVVVVVFMPVLIVGFTFVYAGIVHLCLMLFKGANRPFETTMRAICYSSGAGGAFNVIPFCGGMIGGIWALVALCIGLGKAHDTTTEKGVGAVLLPMLLCCLLYGAVIAVVVGVAAAAGAAASGR